MIVDRILIRVMPELMKHDQRLTAENIKAAKEILVPAELYTPAFGVYITRNLSDYINRLQFEFVRAMKAAGANSADTK